MTLERLLKEINGNKALFVEVPFDRIIAQTLRQVKRSQIPDLPDRIIAATAVHLNLPIISRDRKILLSGLNTIW
jgi:predicted nucleic acid-binding protein